MVMFRKGDEVTVRTTVKYDQSLCDERVWLDIGVHASVRPDEITMASPKIFVGDHVALIAGASSGRVCAIHERHLWVELSDQRFATWPSASVRRLEDESKMEDVS